MDRTVPSSGTREIDLYLRTYYSLLRSTREVPIKAFMEAHKRMNSALHAGADSPEFDGAAFTYAILRLPECIDRVRLVIMGQSKDVFAQYGFSEVESWEQVSAPARRRRTFFDGVDTLAVYIASRSDIDDLVPILTAYQIERRKLHELLREPIVTKQIVEMKLPAGSEPTPEHLTQLASLTGVPFEDWARLVRIWQDDTFDNLATIARQRTEIAIRSLAGSLIDYKRATRRWWRNVERSLPDVSVQDRPIHFISSNTHTMANLLAGYALQQEAKLDEFIFASGSQDLRQEYRDILERNKPSSRENFFYYALKKYEAEHPAEEARRLAHERDAGILRVPSEHAFDIEVQVVELRRLDPALIDPRLRLPGIEQLAGSDALIVNVDYPLGMAAYQVLAEIARNVGAFRGLYVMGKAGTLNGRIGDVMIPNVIHDEQSMNTYLIDNCFTADDVSPYLVYGAVLDNQKAISVPGTFLQNETYMSVFYHEGYTDIEMEAGPYLSCVYEMVRPRRHPYNELIDLHNTPFPLGLLHYASDTPLSRATNLGSKNLSYFGMDATYATMIAIMRAIIEAEISQAG